MEREKQQLLSGWPCVHGATAYAYSFCSLSRGVGPMESSKPSKHYRAQRDVSTYVRGALVFHSVKSGKQDEHRQAAIDLLRTAEQELQSDTWDMVILDEFNYAYSFGFIHIDDLESLLAIRPAHTHLIFTGRNASPELIDRADLVTEMRLIKHPYQEGIKAQKGIEFLIRL